MKKDARSKCNKASSQLAKDRVILEGEKCEALYKLKKGNSIRSGVSRISLEESSSRGRASRKTKTGREPGQSIVEGERVHSSKARDGPSHSGKSAKDHQEKGQELKDSQYGYNQRKNQGSNPKSQGVLLKA